MLREIVTRDPSHTRHLLTLARLLKQTGRTAEARDAFDKLIETEALAEKLNNKGALIPLVTCWMHSTVLTRRLACFSK